MSSDDDSSRRDPPASRPRLTDSPWFWLLIFANAALVGLTLIGPKYDRRQGAIERRYEARQEIARRAQEGSPEEANPSAGAAEGPGDEYTLPGNSARIVPLRSLAVALVLLNALAIVVFCMSRLRLAAHLRSNTSRRSV
jgi:hypothetical protein